MDASNIWDKIAQLKDVRKKKEEYYRQKRIAKDRALQVDDLVRRFHRVGKVELPFPSLFTQEQLKKYFGDLEKIDLSNAAHVAAVVFFLEHSDDVSIMRMTHTELEEAIMARMSKIPFEQLNEYIECITQLFLAIKKKSTQYQISMLENLLKTMGINLKDPEPAAAGRS